MQSTKKFGDLIKKSSAESWRILWAAGTGVVGTEKTVLQRETAMWNSFLQSLTVLPTDKPGMIFFASSAGAIYGSQAGELTENTPPQPISEYGKQKLIQEQLLHDQVVTTPHIRFLIGRLSNLYGTRQNPGKPQGLISRLSRSIIRRQPLHLYVPLDTVRDYLHADDCARQILTCLRLMDSQSEKSMTKIFASEERTTIAEIIRIFRTITKSQPRIVCAPNTVRNEHPPSVSFRSVIWSGTSQSRSISLLQGIHAVHRDQMLQYQKGMLS